MTLEEAKHKADEVRKQIEDASKGDPAKMKKLAIAKSIIEATTQLASDFNELSRYERKLPRIARKKKYSLRESKRLRILLKLRTYMSTMQIAMKIQQPIPKYLQDL